jgi:hypothetical protein
VRGEKRTRRRQSRPQPRPVGHARGIRARKRSRAGANPDGRSRVTQSDQLELGF